MKEVGYELNQQMAPEAVERIKSGEAVSRRERGRG
jgi:hypothetical protein